MNKVFSEGTGSRTQNDSRIHFRGGVPCLDYKMNKKESATMTTKFTPLHDRILVRRVEEAGTTRGGLIIPDSAKDKPQEGAVISVGNGKTNDEGKLFPLAVKEGDSILFGKYAGTEIKLDGEDFLIMREEEVLGIVTGTAKKESVSARPTVGARK
jgi:chaperonin GroES